MNNNFWLDDLWMDDLWNDDLWRLNWRALESDIDVGSDRFSTNNDRMSTRWINAESFMMFFCVINISLGDISPSTFTIWFLGAQKIESSKVLQLVEIDECDNVSHT